MRITLVGSRHFGVTTLNMLRQHGIEIAGVVVADAEDRLAAAARDAGIEVRVQADPKLVVASEIADRTDLIVTAHSHARVSREALAARSACPTGRPKQCRRAGGGVQNIAPPHRPSARLWRAIATGNRRRRGQGIWWR